MDAPDCFSAACSARASTQTSPTGPKVTGAEGVGVTTLVMTTMFAVTSTPPMTKGSGLPGVAGFVLPTKLRTTPDDLQREATWGRMVAGGRARGRIDDEERRFSYVRAPHSPTFTRSPVMRAVPRFTLSLVTRITRTLPFVLTVAGRNAHRRAAAARGMAMAQLRHVISRGVR